MNRSPRSRSASPLTGALAILVLSCSDTSAPAVIDLGGSWTFSDFTLYSSRSAGQLTDTGYVLRNGFVTITPSDTVYGFQARYQFFQFDSMPGQPAFRSPSGFTTAGGIIRLRGDSIVSLLGVVVPLRAVLRPGFIVWTGMNFSVCAAYAGVPPPGTTTTCETRVWWQRDSL